MRGHDKELARFVEQHHLPDDYTRTALEHFLPLVDWLLEKKTRSGKSTFVAGIYGAQGSGKSTLANLLECFISATGKTVVSLSLDDFYLTREERAQLAANISPLLASRGPPGTHDIELALKTIRRATALAAGETMAIPRFDKAADDRVAESDYDTVCGPIDFVILEGWCLGCIPVTAEELVEPINDLERNEDQDGVWRQFVNESIYNYQPLFDLVDALIMLQTASFESALRWRAVQEEKLRASARSSRSGIMSGAQLERFVQFFERVSRTTEIAVESRADMVITQDQEHRVSGIRRIER